MIVASTAEIIDTQLRVQASLDFLEGIEQPRFSFQVERDSQDALNWESDNQELYARKDYLLEDNGTVFGEGMFDEFHGSIVRAPSEKIEGFWLALDLDEPALDRWYLTAEQNRHRLEADCSAWPRWAGLDMEDPSYEEIETDGELWDIEDFDYLEPNYPDSTPVDDFDEVPF